MASSTLSSTSSSTVSFCSAMLSGPMSVSDCDVLAGFETVLASLLLGVIFVGVVANVVVLFVIAAYGEMHSFANLFVANLCLTHVIHLCVIGVTDFVHYIEVATGVGTVGEGLLPASLHLYISLVIINSTCAMLTALTIERYVTIVVDLKRAAQFQTIRLAVVFCVLVWGISIVVSALVFHGDYSDSVNEYADQQYRTVIIISFVYSYIIPLIIVGIVYRCIKHEVRKQEMKRKHKKKAATSASSSSTMTADEGRHDHELQILKTVCSVIVVFAVNFGCFYVISIFLFVLPLDQLMVTIISQMSKTVAILTASAHPIIFCLTHPSFHPYVKRLVFPRNAICVRCRRGARCLFCCGYHNEEGVDDGDRDDRPNRWKNICDSFRPDLSCCDCCPRLPPVGGRPASIRMMMRKVSTLGGTVNASDEFVLVNRDKVESEIARKAEFDLQLFIQMQLQQQQDGTLDKQEQEQQLQKQKQQREIEEKSKEEDQKKTERNELQQDQQKQSDTKQEQRDQHQTPVQEDIEEQKQDENQQEQSQDREIEDQQQNYQLYRFPLALFSANKELKDDQEEDGEEEEIEEGDQEHQPQEGDGEEQWQNSKLYHFPLASLPGDREHVQPHEEQLVSPKKEHHQNQHRGEKDQEQREGQENDNPLYHFPLASCSDEQDQEQQLGEDKNQDQWDETLKREPKEQQHDQVHDNPLYEFPLAVFPDEEDDDDEEQSHDEQDSQDDERQHDNPLYRFPLATFPETDV